MFHISIWPIQTADAELNIMVLAVEKLVMVLSPFFRILTLGIKRMLKPAFRNELIWKFILISLSDGNIEQKQKYFSYKPFSSVYLYQFKPLDFDGFSPEKKMSCMLKTEKQAIIEYTQRKLSEGIHFATMPTASTPEWREKAKLNWHFIFRKIQIKTGKNGLMSNDYLI